MIFRWDWGTCTAAAQFGHLKLLKYLRSKGCDWNDQTIAKCKHPWIVQWAKDHGCQEPDPESDEE